MDSLKTMWWLVFIRGIAVILFGGAAFFAPKATLVVLWGLLAVFLFEPLVAAQAFVWIVGIWAIFSGILSIILAFRIRSAASKLDSPGGGGPMAAA